MLTTRYHQTDSEELLAYNMEHQPASWRWHKETFDYTFNSRGWRMNKEIEDVDYSNYLLFLGCSYTVGIGLPVEETFPAIIAQQTGRDYINAAQGGTSTYYSWHTCIDLIATLPGAPGAIVINWPALHRNMYWQANGQPVHCSPRLMNNVPAEFKTGFTSHWMNETDLVNKFNKARLSLQLLCAAKNIPLWDFTQFDTPVQQQTGVPLIMADTGSSDSNGRWARDIQRGSQWTAHLGPDHHQYVANRFLANFS
jgi:hypothetical protein